MPPTRGAPGEVGAAAGVGLHRQPLLNCLIQLAADRRSGYRKYQNDAPDRVHCEAPKTLCAYSCVEEECGEQPTATVPVSPPLYAMPCRGKLAGDPNKLPLATGTQ